MTLVQSSSHETELQKTSPIFLTSLFPSISGTERVTCGSSGYAWPHRGGGVVGGGVVGRSSPWGWTAEDAWIFFPCSLLPMKILENSTFPSAKHADTVTPGKV